jgi:multidrug efflux pump subunit AcrB
MIWNFCIRRPILTIVLFVVIAIFGLYGYFQMPVREYPNIDFPVVSVNVVLPGAEPGVIETEVVEPLEEEINTVEGLKKLTSTAREGVGTVVAEFELWRDIDVAAQDVRDRVNRARRELPDGIESPIVRKLDPDARAIMWIALTGDDRWDEVRLSRYADEMLKERLESVRGVGHIQIGGERRYAVRLYLDPGKLAAHHLTVQDVVSTIQRENVDIFTGRVESRQREFLVKTQGQFESPERLNELIVTYNQGAPVRIRDIGMAMDGVENDRRVARFLGQKAVGLGVVKQSDANTVALGEALARIETYLKSQLPAGFEYAFTGQAQDFQESFYYLTMTIAFSILFVYLVLAAQFESFLHPFTILLTVPLAVVGALGALWIGQLSFGIVAFIGLIMLVGMATKNAILMIDYANILVARGQGIVEAAKQAARVRFRPVIMTTVSTVLGITPIALGVGAGGEARAPMGVAVASGLLATTGLTLLIIPVVYTLVDRLRRRFWTIRRD